MTENGNMIMPVIPQGFGGNDGFGGNGAWWIIVILALLGWGNGGFGNFGGNSGVGAEVQRGFDQNAVMNGLNNIQGTLTNQNMNLQSSFQNCCCENRLGIADLKYTIATEASATRANCNDNNQKILDKLCQLELDGVKQNYEGQLRALQLQLAQANSDNQALRFAASQGAQTAQILADNNAQTVNIERYLAPTPVPAYIVQNPNCCQNMYGNCGSFAA